MFRRTALAAVALIALVACKKIPLKPAKPLPAGTAVLYFTRSIKGPLDLSIDGTRIPVAQGPKGGQILTIQGLQPGRHRYFLSSPQDAFSPDQTELQMPDDGGYYEVVFAQRFSAVLYGKPAETPVAEGLPGVKATLSAK